MTKSTGPLAGLDLRLPERGSRARLRSLHQQLRGAILAGRLQAGTRLPSTRTLAAELGVSRNTVVAAYDLLLSEGYLAARRGAGAFVAGAVRASRPRPAAGRHDARLLPAWRRAQVKPLDPEPASGGFDFRVGLPDNRSFPYRAWKRLSARALRSLSRTPASYGEPQGREALREAIAQHVSFTRAVACGAENIIVTAGAQQAFDLLARVLVEPGRTVVAVEEPGYPPLRMAFSAAGARVRPVPVDAEGLRADRLPRQARIVCVTPSHQFPLGAALSLERRVALLQFAAERRAVVVEDDYDSEFRFGGRALDALQTLDRHESVFYVGTFSKSLFPTLRIGFIVAPGWAVQALVAAKQLMDWHSPMLAQGTLAAFISEGHLARHVRRMRGLYAERRSRLLDAVRRHCAGRLHPLPGDAGLHLAARLERGLRATDVAARARAERIAVYPLERYFAGKAFVNGLAFGYGMIDAERIDEAIGRLARLLK